MYGGIFHKHNSNTNNNKANLNKTNPNSNIIKNKINYTSNIKSSDILESKIKKNENKALINSKGKEKNNNYVCKTPNFNSKLHF